MKAVNTYGFASCRSFQIGGAILLIAFLLNACSTAGTAKAGKQAARASVQPAAVEVVKAARRKISSAPEVNADVMPSATFNLVTHTGGIADKVFSKRGAAVKAGDVLARLSSSDVQFEKEKADLDLKNAQDALAAAQNSRYDNVRQAQQEVDNLSRQYNKLRNDYDEGLATRDELDKAAAQLNQKKSDLAYLKKHPGSSQNLPDLQLQVQMAKMAVQQADQDEANLTVKAPDDGILTDFPIEAGEKLQPGAEIGVVQKVNPIKLTAYLTVDEVKQVGDQHTLSFTMPDSNQEVPASVHYISSIADPRTGSYEIDLIARNDGVALKPGMSVQLQLENAQHMLALTVPTYSIIKENGAAYVFVIHGDIAEKRKIGLGRVNEPNQEVLSGIQSGELVVISGQNQLKNGQKVKNFKVQQQN